jgi:hypothetical protein
MRKTHAVIVKSSEVSAREWLLVRALLRALDMVSSWRKAVYLMNN